ncbi:S8 family peptidase [Herbivorax sp. ANBcel31]|uniref:S8 family peptidase n=1 Tax=Herbivorax sp. ANBcel31 TaxID=3069754 RepID=UPI0027B0F000|nr:S8 family peptidase [Herbivorax sp. ANBcel31]MDQ2087212.1 S8 family peptidase [Herbivorax sp. ANBcel31]
MFKKGISILVVICVMVSTVITGFAQNTEDKENKTNDTANIEETKTKKPGQLIVKYKESSSFRSMSNMQKEEKVIKSSDNGLTLIEVEENEVTKKIESLKKDGNVEYVVPNYMRKISRFPIENPNDPEFENQWGLVNINAQDGWVTIDDSEDLSEVTVAVIDTGIDMFHEDLKDVVVEGYDFVDMDDNPIYGPIDEEHASHVAGIIAAKTNNGVGISGTVGQAPVKIMPIRAFEGAWGEDFNIIESIYYAVDNGADVINMSFGGPIESVALNEALEYALSENVVMVAAAGNNAMDALNEYPAAFPGVIAVSATDETDDLTSFSNYGSVIDLAAPGQDILSTIPEDLYDYYEGTSMSAAFVSGACALLLSKNPSLTSVEIEHILADSAKEIGDAGKDKKFGHGLLDINGALMVEEVKPRLEIMNLIDGEVVYDIIDVNTRFTYPENIEKTELYVNDELVETVFEKTDMLNSFEIDTYNCRDGALNIKVVAYEEEKIYQKEVEVRVRNTVYTGLRVKLTHDGEPVSNGFIKVWNKYTTVDGETFYDFVHHGVTAKNGVAVVPGTDAPNGNTYVIVADYALESEGDYSNAIILEEAIAPDIVEIDGKDLVPVTVNTGLDDEQSVFGSYKFPEAENSIQFSILPNTSGEFKAFLSKGIYSFEVVTHKTESNKESSEAIFMLSEKNVLIDGKDTVVNMESDKSKLAKINNSYNSIYGFMPSQMFISMRDKDVMLSKGVVLEDVYNIPEIYVTPGEYIFEYDIMGSKGTDEIFMFLEGEAVSLKEGEEKLLAVGGIFTGKIQTDKTEYIPGEYIDIDASLTDSQGNKIIYADYMNFDPFFVFRNQKSVFYRKDNKKVGLKLKNSLFEVPAEPIEYEFKDPATIELIDSKNNVVKSIPKHSISWMDFDLDQNILSGDYRLKMIVELPYLIQDETDISVKREAKEDAVKFNIELPGEKKATMATIEAINIETGESFYQWGDDLLDGEMFLSLPEGTYKAAVYSLTSDGDQVMYLEDIDSPGEYNLYPDQLENVKFSVKDENENDIEGIVDFKVVFPDSEVPLNFYLSSYHGEGEAEYFITKGVYNIVAEVLSYDTYNTECIILKEEVFIGDDANNENETKSGWRSRSRNRWRNRWRSKKESDVKNSQQTIEFKMDNLTEVSLDSRSDGDEAIMTISDPKTGLSAFVFLEKNNSFKISKGFYDIELICEKIEYGNAYSYTLSSQRDFSKDSTQIGFGTKFSISVNPDKTYYKKNDILSSKHSIMDRFGNKLISAGSLNYFYFIFDAIKQSKGENKIKQDNGKYQVFDVKEKEYIEVPYDIRAPFIYIINSEGEIVLSKKSVEHYTNSEIEIEKSWAKTGDYNIRLTIDVDADGSLSAESPFEIR